MRGQGTVERLSSGRWRLRLPRSLSKGKRSGATYDSEGEARGVLVDHGPVAVDGDDHSQVRRPARTAGVTRKPPATSEATGAQLDLIGRKR